MRLEEFLEKFYIDCGTSGIGTKIIFTSIVKYKSTGKDFCKEEREEKDGKSFAPNAIAEGSSGQATARIIWNQQIKNIVIKLGIEGVNSTNEHLLFNERNN
jgi:hypothetical protein